jgi:Zn-dependent protease
MRDRDPMNWSVPLPWRPLGVAVRVHILFPCVILGVVLWVATSAQFAADLWPRACAVLTLLFFSALLHEFGHVIAVRRVDGDVSEIVLWPLGGLGSADLPRRPAAVAFAAMGGPLVNLGIAVVAGAALFGMGLVPPFNPLSSPLNPHMYSWKDRITYFSTANPGEAEYWSYQEPETTKLKQVEITFEKRKDGTTELKESNPPVVAKDGNLFFQQGIKEIQVLPARLNNGQWVLAQLFFVNWFLFLVNLLPAFPLDGGRLMQSFLWRRADYRSATATAAFLGFLVMLCVGVYAIAVNQLLPAGLAAMMYVRCRRELVELEKEVDEDQAATDYDFSQGYSSLERDDNEDASPAPPPPAKPGWLQAWAQRRADRRAERERELREADARRMDELLDKIQREGMQSLSEDEIKFLTRMSSNTRNKR